MNAGGVRSSLLFNQISGGEQPGEVTYAEAFAVQPFGNTLVVKTCTGQQLYDVLEQQFENPAAGQQRVMPVSHSDVHVHAERPRRPEASSWTGRSRSAASSWTRPPATASSMNNFIADGGDGFTVFRSCTNPLGGEVDIDAFGRYLLAHSPLASARR